jgi:8-amino-7-oxononanoate synthase
MDRIEGLLRERKEKNLLRALHPANFRKEGKIYLKGKEYIDFSSNDYLGLAAHPKLKSAARKAQEELGTGSSASRLLSGDSELHHILEEKVARFKDKESALVFNSGYQANVGVISALCQRGDAIFSDKLNHASIIDGMLLSGARIFRFSHNDPGHLEFLMARQRRKFRNCLIITETVFSMDGDMSPLAELVSIKEKFDCKIMVDEAHATGIFGKKGTGIVEETGLTGRIDLIMGTFSKALGSFGAYLACPVKVKEYLVNTCRGFIYSTALPPAVIAANIAALEVVREEPFRRKILLENASSFREKLGQRNFKIKGSSQIVPLLIGDNQKTLDSSQELKERGYWVFPIRPPTVPKGESRLRFSLSYNHTKETLERLFNDICALKALNI